MLRPATTLVAFLLLGAASLQGEKLKSGPQPGEYVPAPFHFLNVNGSHAGSPHCLVCDYGLKPVVAVFAREVPTDEDKSKALLGLLAKLDEVIGQKQKAELCGFAVFLSKDYSDETTRKSLVKRLE